MNITTPTVEIHDDLELVIWNDGISSIVYSNTVEDCVHGIIEQMKKGKRDPRYYAAEYGQDLIDAILTYAEAEAEDIRWEAANSE